MTRRKHMALGTQVVQKGASLKTKPDISNLRSTLDWLRAGGNLIETDVEVDPDLEITGIQKSLDGSLPILFSKIKGYPYARAVTNLFANMGIVDQMFGWESPQERTRKLAYSITHPIPPVQVSQKEAPSQELVITNDLEVNKHVIAIRHTELESERTIGSGNSVVVGPYFHGGSHIGGADSAGDLVLRLFREAGIPCEGVSRTAGRMTPVKTRIMAGGYESTRQQVVRLDREPEPSLPDDVEARLIAAVKAAADGVDAFLVSDYGYGCVTARVFEAVLETARPRGAVVAVDSRYDLPRFRGATAATPNEPEVEALAGAELGDDRALEKAGRAVLERLESRYLLITRGSRGMAQRER